MISNLFNRKSIHTFFFLFFFLLIYDLSGQTIIEGEIKDTLGDPIRGASILIKDINQNKTFSYALSDAKGYFKLSVSQKDEKLFLVVRSMVYETQTQNILNKDQVIDIMLKDEVFELEEIKLKHEPIQQKKDTLSYKVSSFSEKNDRSIADVIKHVPGLTIKTMVRFFIKANRLIGFILKTWTFWEVNIIWPVRIFLMEKLKKFKFLKIISL